jgi:cell division protein FtsQ
MARGRTGGSRRPARAASAVVPFPRTEPGDRLDLARFVPSGRSLLISFGLVAAALVAFWGARSTSVFGVQEVVVEGAPRPVEREVRKATSALLGESLLTVDATAVAAKVRALPSVAGASVDRAFPHTLVVRVSPERPVAVARRGRSAWLVTASGKVVRPIELGTERALPRLWLQKGVDVRVGGSLPASFAPATRSLGAVHDVKLRRRIKAVRSTGTELTLVPRRGPEIRLGDPTDVMLKLAVAARVFPLLEEGTLYLDVSVPERPVASRYLQPSGRG